jgi:molybdopterin-guanine dinucleotide biosynthesis protein MobB
MADVPPILSVVGRKNSGKTALLVALAAELRRRGHRVASLKHGHHGFEMDHPGRDSWRHFHEGEAEAVVVIAADRVAMVMRTAEEEDPGVLVARLFGGRGYDLVLAEGYKHGPFPKIEIFRHAVHERPLTDPCAPAAGARRVALVTDATFDDAVCPVVRLDAPEAGAHVPALADLVEGWLSERRAGG